METGNKTTPTTLNTVGIKRKTINPEIPANTNMNKNLDNLKNIKNSIEQNRKEKNNQPLVTSNDRAASTNKAASSALNKSEEKILFGPALAAVSPCTSNASKNG